MSPPPQNSTGVRPRVALLGRFTESASALRFRGVVSARMLLEGLWAAGLDPVTLLPTADSSDWHERLTGFDGVLFAGGGDINPATKEPRWTGSYTFNGWMYKGGFWEAGGNRPLTANAFINEGDIHSPSLTPVFSDGYWVDVWPQEIDPPARDLLEGGPVAAISTITIARHGAGPNPGYNKWPPGAKLPAAINVAFADGHVSLIPLERLWELYWHKNWNPPTSRPK